MAPRSRLASIVLELQACVGAHEEVQAERGRRTTCGGVEPLAEEGDIGLGVVIRLQQIEAGVGEQRVQLLGRGQVAGGGCLAHGTG